MSGNTFQIELSKIKESLQAELLVKKDITGIYISGVYASDLMSDVLAYGQAGSILLTGLNTIQTVISSHMVEFKAIAFLRHKIPTEEMRRFAEEKDIVLLSSPLDTYRACVQIGKLEDSGQSSPQVFCEKVRRTDSNIFSYDYEIEGGDFANAGMISTQVKSIMKEIGYDAALIRRVVVSICEGEMNVVMHAKKGKLNFMAGEKEIKVVIDDEGKGIPDIELAMQEGYTTATKEQQALGFGAGMGLPNMKKNSDVLNITSEVGKGTRVEMRFFVEGHE